MREEGMLENKFPDQGDATQRFREIGKLANSSA
jgi:hypothetical protein